MSATIGQAHVSQQLLTVDGRRIAYDLIGDGRPVFFFHGSPASRLEARFLAAAATSAGVQLIAPDRPGIGGSDPSPGRRLLDWPPVVDAISRQVGVQRFSVIGYSTGALYAYACAYALADCVISATVISGTGTPDLMRGWNAGWLTLLASRAIPVLGNALFGSVAARARRDPDGFQVPGLAPVDRAALNEQAMRKLFLEGFTEAFSQGPNGVVQDQVLVTRDWGFEAQSIHVPMTLWHGAEDGTVPPRVAMAMSRRVPAATLELIPGEGHISLIAHQADAIFASLASRPSEAAPV